MAYGYGLPKGIKTLLIANAAIFIATTLLTAVVGTGVYVQFIYLFGLVPRSITTNFMIWQFFTHMFLHANLGHIALNMFGLWMFGTELEYSWGTREFLKFYIACGIGGGILVWLTAMFGMSSPLIPTIGASGAIFGVLVAFAMMWPDRVILIFGIIPMRALPFVIIFAAFNVFQGLTGRGAGIAWFAHVGGAVTGFIYLKFGWRILAYSEDMWRRLKRRRFRVIKGGSIRKDGQEFGDGHPDFESEVDRILDKIAHEGMESLTEKERRILEKASKRKGN